MNFKKEVLKVVRKIPEGRFLSYLEVAKKVKKPTAARAVGNILAKLKDPKIPCHRVIKSNGLVGGYLGSEKNSWKKVGLLLKEGAIGVIPTDTTYGIATSVFKKNAIEKISQLRKRSPQKSVIILISSIEDLRIFGIKISSFKKILERLWPGKISIVLPCKSPKFFYLHRGTKTLAFGLPKEKEILKILFLSGPLAVFDANWEGKIPTKTIFEAKRYFGKKVFYHGKGKLTKKPSTIIDITKKPFQILRKGAGFQKIKRILSPSQYEVKVE